MKEVEFKKCIICKKNITERETDKAKTCNQSCAGKLAWRTINGTN